MTGYEPDAEEQKVLPPAERPPGPPAPADPPARRARRSRGRSFFWPLLLIGLGVIFLLSNFGLLPGNIWDVLWRFWPLLLIIAGLDLILGRRSTAGSILAVVLSLLLIGGAVLVSLFARELPALVQFVDSPELKHEMIAYPLQGVERADVVIDWSTGPGRLQALEDSNNLIEGDINYYGNLHFDAETQGNRAQIELDSRFNGIVIGPTSFGGGEDSWTIFLSPAVPLSLNFDIGPGRADLDLRRLQVETLRLDVGPGAVELIVPERGAIEAVIDGGPGQLVIELPEGMEARLRLERGPGSFRAGSRLERVPGEGNDDVSVWETPGFRGADNFIELEIDQGPGSVSFR